MATVRPIVLLSFALFCITCANSNSSQSDSSLLSNALSSGIYLLPSNSIDSSKPNANIQIAYIALLLPLHRSTANQPLPSWARNRTGLCSNELNSAAVYDLEASLWTIDRLKSISRPQNGVALHYRLVIVDSCEQASLLAQRVQTLLTNPKWTLISKKLLTVISSTPAEQLLGILPLLSAHNLTLISSQDLTWALSGQTQLSAQSQTNNEPTLKILQTALPPSHYAQAALAFLRQAKRNRFSIVYSYSGQTANPASGLLRSFLQLLDSSNSMASHSQPNQTTTNHFCLQTSVSLPNGGVSQDSASASQVLMQLQHELLLMQDHSSKQQDQLSTQQSANHATVVPAPSSVARSETNNASEALDEERLRMLLSDEEELDNEELEEESHLEYDKASVDEQLLLLATDSADTRAILSSYQHLLHAGLLGQMRFVLLRESNLNIVSGLEQSLLQTIVLREHQPSLIDFVQYFARLRTSSASRRNPFFAQFWQESTKCNSADCQFKQIEPVHNLNTMQAVALAIQAVTTWKDRLCITCSHQWSFENLSQVRQHLLQHVLGRNWPMNQLSSHFTGTLRFEPAPHCRLNHFCPAIPLKSVDVLRFREAENHFRFDRLQSVPLTGPASITLFDYGINLKSNFFFNQTLHKLFCAPPSSLSSQSTMDLKQQSLQNNMWTASAEHSSIDSLRQWSHALNTWHANSKLRAVAEVLSIVGILLIFACFAYLMLTLDRNYGTTVVGYLILSGLLCLYAINLLFLQQSGSYALCWLRSFLMPAAYTLVFSGLLVKVLNAWRLNGLLNVQLLHSALSNANANSHHTPPSIDTAHAYVLSYGSPWNAPSQTHYVTGSTANAFAYTSNSARSSPRSLLLMCIGLICLQCLTSVLWLAIYPPRAVLGPSGSYRCISSLGSGALSLLHTDCVSSLLFVSLLLLITVYFALLCWRQPVNQHECRWILFCSYLTAMCWLSWALLVKLHFIYDRDLSIAFTNILVSSNLFICLFVRKVFAFEQLRRQINQKSNQTSPSSASSSGADANKHSKRKLKPFGANFGRYGTLGSETHTNSRNATDLAKSPGSIDSGRDSPDTNSVTGSTIEVVDRSSNKELSNSCDNLDAVSTISGMTTTSSIISSVRGYFRGHQRSDSSVSCSKSIGKPKKSRKHDRSSDESIEIDSANFRSNLKSNGHTKSNLIDATLASGLGAAHLASQQPGLSMIDPMAAELYPMDVYDISQPVHGGASSFSSSSLTNTKGDLFNSNRSLYLMDENGFM